jgi:PadR family transcriptional regulator, regulatory protein PadR
MKRTGHWLHGFLDLCLLALLDTGPDYGFALAQRLAETGLGEVPGGTLYPALLRLEQQGWVSVSWVASESGPRRKYYALTATGRAVLERDAGGWQKFRDSIDLVLGAVPVSVPTPVPVPVHTPSQTRPSGARR